MAYIGSSASPLPVNFSAVQGQSFSGTGAQVAFTLNRSVASPVAIEVLVNNVQQSPYDGSFTVSGSTLTFSEAPSLGTNNIYVIYRDQSIGTLTDLTAYRKAEVDALLATKMPVNGPAFSATLSGNQSMTGNVTTKVAFSVEGFDTNNNYDTSLYRFTPSVAGYYQFNVGLISNSSADLTQVIVYKNGSGAFGAYPTTGQGITFSGLVYLNGTTDYAEVYALFTVNGVVRDLDVFTYFSGFLARSAT